MPKTEIDPSQGFHRFSEAARTAVVASMNEACAHGNAEITPEHLLLAAQEEAQEEEPDGGLLHRLAVGDLQVTDPDN